MNLKDKKSEYVIATFQPGRTSSGDTIKFIADANAIGRSLVRVSQNHEIGHIQPMGVGRVYDIAELNDWLAQPLREAQIDFLVEFFSDLIEAVTNLDEAGCREINSDHQRFREFLATQFRITMDRFRSDQAQWAEVSQFIRQYLNIDSFGQDLLDRDIEALEKIFQNLRLTIRKIVGVDSDPDRTIHERNCPY